MQPGGQGNSTNLTTNHAPAQETSISLQDQAPGQAQPSASQLPLLPLIQGLGFSVFGSGFVAGTQLGSQTCSAGN